VDKLGKPEEWEVQIEIRGVEKLSLRERQVVALKEMGWSTEAVAKQLGLSPATVSTLYNRARNKGYQVVIIMSGDILGLGQPEEDEA